MISSVHVQEAWAVEHDCISELRRQEVDHEPSCRVQKEMAMRLIASVSTIPGDYLILIHDDESEEDDCCVYYIGNFTVV